MQKFIVFAKMLVLIFVVIPSVHAQWDPVATLDLGMGYGQNALSQSVMTNVFNNSNKVTSVADKADYLYLGFSHYSRFEEKIFNAVTVKDQKADKAKLRRFLSGTRTMHHFSERSKTYGLKTSYLSDLLAIGIAWNWEMYHQTSANKQKVLQLRNAIRGNMAKSNVRNQIAKLSEADKRDWILGFMYNNSMIALQIKNAGKLTPSHQQQLAKTVELAGVPDIQKVALK
jgi:hypothetical protein